MRKKILSTLRHVALGGLLLLLLLFVPLGYMVLTFEPNDYRDVLISTVESATGRSLVIEGDLDMHLDLPRIGFSMRGVEFDNALGFGHEPMLSVGRIEVSLRLLPLLFGNLQLHSVALEDWQARLHRKQNGHSNWQDLLGSEPDSVSDGSPVASDRLTLDRVHMRNGGVAFWDEQHDWRIRLSDLELQASDLALGSEVELELSGEVMVWPEVAAGDSRVNATVNLQAELELDLDAQRLSGDDLSLQLELAGPAINIESLKPQVEAGSFHWDLETNMLQAQVLKVEIERAQVEVEEASWTVGHGGAGRISLQVKELPALLTAWQIEAPVMADDRAFRSLEVNAEVALKGEALTIRQLDLMMDDTRLQGEIEVNGFKRPQVTTNLTADEIDLDRYQLASGADSTPVKSADSGRAGLPVEWLRRPQINSRWTVGQIKWRALEATAVQAQWTAKQGIWEINSLTARLADRPVRVSAELDASGGIPAYRVDLNTEQVEIAPLMQSLSGEEEALLSGATDLSLALRGRGQQWQTVTSSLNGTVGLEMHQGALHLGTVVSAVETALAVFQGRESVVREGALLFSSLRANWNVTDGRMHNRDLQLQADPITVTGQGYIDLPQVQADYQMNVTAGEMLEVPLRISGSLNDLSHSVDIPSLATEVIEDQLTEEVEEKVESLKDDAEDTVRGLLDQLF